MQSSDPRLFAKAVAAFQSGSFDSAERDFKKILRGDPKHPGALSLYSVLLMQHGRLAEAVPLLRKAASVNSRSDVTFYNLGLALKGLKQPDEAREAFSKCIEIKPANAEAWNNRGTVFNDLGRYEEAIADFDHAIALAGDYPEASYNRARSMLLAGRSGEAIAAFDLMLKTNPHFVEALTGRAGAQAASDKLADALVDYSEAIRAKPGLIEAWFGQASVLSRLERHQEALEAYGRVLALKPDFTDALVGAGNACKELKRYDEALTAFRRALETQPQLAEAWVGIGNVQNMTRHRDEALAAYSRAIAIEPRMAEAWLGQGSVQSELRQFDDALASFDRAVAIRPDFAEPWVGRGFIFSETGKHQDAAQSFETALRAKPSLRYGKGDVIYAKAHCCDWSNHAAEWTDCLTDVSAGLAAIRPFPALSGEMSAGQQLACAQTYVQDRLPTTAVMLSQGEHYHHDRIRIAYLSGDFREHAVPYLAAGLFEHHDRTAFETIAISVGPDDRSAIRARLNAAFERFIDAQSMPDDQIARLIRDMEIDILIDLTGHTSGSRLAVLSWRPAPIQATYLGFAGTTGTDFVDYLIADPTVIPPDQQPFYTEKIAYLPDCYLPNDRGRAIGGVPNRAAAGLPDTGFVFCSFNQAYKITPDVFDIWMRLLKAVPGSILWLPKFSEATCANLRREAEARGADAGCIVFAERVERQEDHLARLGCADLFLDTPNYNAHSTACDALWAGVPLVTCMGKTFAGRVGASTLKAVGLPDLITTSLEDYEALALKLASDPALLAATRAKLTAQRLTAPLFDTERFTRNLEALYRKMWERAQAGEPPVSLSA